MHAQLPFYCSPVSFAWIPQSKVQGLVHLDSQQSIHSRSLGTRGWSEDMGFQRWGTCMRKMSMEAFLQSKSGTLIQCVSFLSICIPSLCKVNNY